MRTLALLVLTASLSLGQIGAPFLGYFTDGTNIRAAHGIPASSSVGRVIPGEYSLLAPAPGQDFLLAVDRTSGEVSVLRPGRGSATLAGAIAPDAILLSPRGTSAALWFAEAKRLKIVKNLPDAPESHDLDLGFLGDAPTAMAINDDGLFAGAWGDSVRTLGALGEMNWVRFDAAVRALTFFHGSPDLAVSHSLGLSRIVFNGGRAEVHLLLEGAFESAALGVSANNRRVVSVDATGRISAVDLDTGTAISAECSCQPEGLFRLTRGTFRLTGLKQGSYRLFDAESGDVLTAPLTSEELLSEEGARQ